VRSIPLGLTMVRLLLAPLMVGMVYASAPGGAFAATILIAFISDYFDGVIARRVGVASAELRHFDSRADLVFYATAAWVVWRTHPDVVRQFAVAGSIVIALDVVRHVFDFSKFGKDVAYHAWSSKVWGLSLALALVLLMGFGIVQPFVGIAVTLGLIAQVEGLLISVVLPRWTHDVPTLARALQIRRNFSDAPNPQAGTG
jgi:phosphatidylglycerophosphate synthase